MSNTIEFIDGIINLEFFNKSKIKILWILKEVNDQNNNIKNKDLREILQDIKTDNGIEKGWVKTFAPIVYATYGILNDVNIDSIPFHYENPNIIDVLKEIAYINVKKTSGGKSIHKSVLLHAYLNNKTKLFAQINEINPDIIIYGGTFFLFENDNDFFLKNKNIKHINAYHPAQTSKSQKIYISEILNLTKK